MKTLLAGLSVLALTAGSAFADEPTPVKGDITQIKLGGDISVNDAWKSAASDNLPKYVGPLVPESATPADPQAPSVEKPKFSAITIREEKTTKGKKTAAYVDQVGWDNRAEIGQTTAGGGAIADLIQVGEGNVGELHLSLIHI